MKINDILPMKGHVLVKLPEKVTEVGGLILAGNATNDAPVRGEVIRIPEGGSLFVVGDLIYFRKYAIDDLKFTNDAMEEIVVNIVDEREILGVYSPLPEPTAEIDIVEVRAQSKEADQALRDKL